MTKAIFMQMARNHTYTKGRDSKLFSKNNPETITLLKLFAFPLVKLLLLRIQ